MYQIGLGPVLNPVEHQLIDAGFFFFYITIHFDKFLGT